MKKSLKYLFFFLIALFLLWFTFRKQNFGEIWAQLGQVKLHWVALICFITFLNHLSRNLRWQMTFEPLGYSPRFWPTFAALMFGYLASYAIPRMGEISRCLALQKREKVPLQLGLGTVVSERVIDLCCLGAVTLLAVWLEFRLISDFLWAQILYPQLNTLITGASWVLLLWGLGLLLLSFVFLWIIKKMYKRHSQKIFAFLSGIGRGIISIVRLKNKTLFLLHSLFIWLTYFLMTYLWFYAFDATAHLSPSVGLALMVVGSLGRLVPVQGGGMGAYHFLFTQAMMLYGITETDGLVLATVIHGFQSVYYLLVGSLCAAWLFWKKTD